MPPNLAKCTYFTYLYIYSRRSHQTGRETIYVNPHANTVVVVRPLQAPVRINISKAPAELSKSIMRITAIVTKEIKEFHGTTIQDSNERDRVSQARMAIYIYPNIAIKRCTNPKASSLPQATPHLIPGQFPVLIVGLELINLVTSLQLPKRLQCHLPSFLGCRGNRGLIPDRQKVCSQRTT